MAKAARSVRVIVPPLAIVLTLRPGAVDRERKSDGETRQGVATRSVRTISRLLLPAGGRLARWRNPISPLTGRGGMRDGQPCRGATPPNDTPRVALYPIGRY